MSLRMELLKNDGRFASFPGVTLMSKVKMCEWAGIPRALMVILF